MKDVAADRDGETLDAAEIAPDGQRVEQRLGWMLMRAVAGVDHRAIDFAGQEMHGARVMVPHHQNVGPHGVERHGGVDQRLALFDARRRDRHVHHVRAQSLAGKLERRLRAGRRLEEQIDLGAATQSGALLLDLPRDRHRLVGEIEQRHDLLARQVLDAKEMALGEDGRGRGDHRCRHRFRASMSEPKREALQSWWTAAVSTSQSNPLGLDQPPNKQINANKRS